MKFSVRLPRRKFLSLGVLVIVAVGVFVFYQQSGKFYYHAAPLVPPTQQIPKETDSRKYVQTWTKQGPIICTKPGPAPEKLHDETSREYKADNSYQLGTLDLEEYYKELVAFYPSREENLRHFLQPKTPRLNSQLSYAPATLTEMQQIPPNIWQTGPLPYSKIVDKLSIKQINSWRSQTNDQAVPQFNVETGTWSSSWKYHYVDDEELKAMWPDSLKVLKESAASRPVILADSWRLFILAEHGGIYSDIDTELKKPVDRWWSDAHFGICDPNHSSPSLIVGIEQDNTYNIQPWYFRHARPLQFVQWTFASAPGHPVVIDALQKVHKNVDHAYSQEKHENFSRIKAGDILKMTGPGPFTDAVLRYLAVRYNIHWWDILSMAEKSQLSAMQIGDVLILPRRSFNPRAILGVSYFNRHEGVYLDHTYAGSWRSPKLF